MRRLRMAQYAVVLDVVLQAVCTQQNASIQRTASPTRAAHFGSSQTAEATAGVLYSSEKRSEGTMETTPLTAVVVVSIWCKG